MKKNLQMRGHFKNQRGGKNRERDIHI